uniref:Putative ovule protein n=1 Tax=Solanum chacoense TaxID=4108 RepID=A0A0V0HAR3_SOLCH
MHQSSMEMYTYEETMAITTSVCWDIKRASLSMEVVISKSYSRLLWLPCNEALLAANGTYSSSGTQRILTRLGDHLGSEKF